MSGGAAGAGRRWWISLLLRGPADRGSVLARVALTALIAAGAALTVYSGYIHLYLWGRQPYPYRDIPTIGPLFLLQGIAAIVVGLLVVVTRRFFAVIIGAGLLAVSVAALVIDVEVGMFGFQDSWSVPYATSTLHAEIAGAVVLLTAAAMLAWPAAPGRRSGRRSGRPSGRQGRQ